MRKTRRTIRVERLERRELLAGDGSLHNVTLPPDVNNDTVVTPLDALLILNTISRRQAGGSGEAAPQAPIYFTDVNNDGETTPLDALMVLNHLANPAGESVSTASMPVVKAEGVGTTFNATFNYAETINQAENLLTAEDVKTLLDRASRLSVSNEAIIAIVDRSGRILGVRVEERVQQTFAGRPVELAFAIDGAVAKARTAAFFSNNEAPLPSRTIRFISQSTVTQREVESFSLAEDEKFQGPGFVAPIGPGGKFPPGVNFTPQVDLFAIEHQSRDSRLHAGADGIRGTGDDFMLEHRFNANPAFIPPDADKFFKTWPESYGKVSGEAPKLQSRGIATLPGGVPLYKTVVDSHGNPVTSPVSKSINLVGGIGVFFPGPDGFATHEQNFVHASNRGGIPQTNDERLNAPRVLEAEYIALAAAAGGGISGASAFIRDVSDINARLPKAERFVAINGRIDLVGITLEIYGPTPTQAHPVPGIDRLLAFGRARGINADASGMLMPVNTDGDPLLAGQAVPQGWLVAPRDSSQPGGLTAAQVRTIIDQGRAAADQTRAAIRLVVDNNFRPGARTKMVLAVADTNGELLGVFRMDDATIFSIDVAIAKARNTAYYADPVDLVNFDRLDFNGDGVFGTETTSLAERGDTLPRGTALTNRTFRFVVTPRFPTGIEVPASAGIGLQNHPQVFLRDQRPNEALLVGPESILQMPGIHPLTAENIDPLNPLPASVYRDPENATFVSFASFVPGRNFRDPGDAEVIIHGPATAQPLANQNGVVFFPGSTPLYADAATALPKLIGGFGVSGDGVDQDDVVTASGQVGFAPPQSIRADTFTIGNIRLPFQKFNRNPLGA